VTDMTAASFDVAVVGGGPGGSATALSLRAHAPSLSVVLIEASHYEAFRIGETLPPPAQSLLEHLGVWSAFQGQHHRQVHGTSAAWGSAAALDNDFIFMPANTGWHLDRAAFDWMLAEEAHRLGATLILDARVREVKRTGDAWLLKLSTGSTVAAHFIVDATGGPAPLARSFGARFVEADCLVGIAGFFECSNGDPRTLVEAFEGGWWYTAGLPDGRRIVACMTDADLARLMRLNDAAEWRRRLAAMRNVGATVQQDKPCSPVVVRSAASRRLDPVAGEHWLAVGDSASRFDPLASQGIVKALRSGVFASYAIGDLLARGDDSGVKRYARYVSEEFKSYIEVRGKYYREEQRWPASEFWRRRQETNGDSPAPTDSQFVRAEVARAPRP
jgi:flavin-dependent dehydrogenase